jgi:hypothetical protein
MMATVEMEIQTQLHSAIRNATRPFIVFRCMELCGGFGDRLNGMITVFYLALLLKRNLLFMVDFPFPFALFFNAGKNSGKSYDSEAHRRLCPNHASQIVKNWIDVHVDDVLIGADFEKEWSAYECVQIRINQMKWKTILQNKLISNSLLKLKLEKLTFVEMAHIALKFLLVPKSTIFVNPIMFSENRIKIGIHHRLGDTPFVRNGVTRHSLSDTRCFASKAVSVCESAQSVKSTSGCSYFLSCDSVQACRILRQHLAPWNSTREIVENVGPIQHIDKPRHQNLTNSTELVRLYSRTFRDWVALSMMDKLVISRSTFSETAAFAARSAETFRFAANDPQLFPISSFSC